jgi:hypothetical protein
MAVKPFSVKITDFFYTAYRCSFFAFTGYFHFFANKKKKITCFRWSTNKTHVTLALQERSCPRHLGASSYASSACAFLACFPAPSLRSVAGRCARQVLYSVLALLGLRNEHAWSFVLPTVVQRQAARIPLIFSNTLFSCSL